MGRVILVLLIIVLVVRLSMRISQRLKKTRPAKVKELKPISDPRSLSAQLRTVLVFTKLGTERFFRDRLAQFFAILFPLIFLFVFGSLGKNSGNLSFHVAIINQSQTVLAKNFSTELHKAKSFKVDKTATSLSAEEDKLTKHQLEGIIVLPPNFGQVSPGSKVPSGQVKVIYSASDNGTGQTLTSVLGGYAKSVNAKLLRVPEPITVASQQLNAKSLTSFDYTFSGLLGFSIIGLGIFGPVNVFPELKKQGVLRRLHTTPLRVWQYFLSTMFGQAITGIIAIAIQFLVATEVFHLKVNGNYLEILIFTVYSIFMILGLGLAIGGWARNERQAAPLSNIIVFPMLFLSGTFFPRYLMPAWLQHITTYLPLTPVIDGLRLLTTEGKHLTQIGPQLGLVTIWFVIIYIVAFRVFKWE